jgi:hypothetical protein
MHALLVGSGRLPQARCGVYLRGNGGGRLLPPVRPHLPHEARPHLGVGPGPPLLVVAPGRRTVLADGRLVEVRHKHEGAAVEAVSGAGAGVEPHSRHPTMRAPEAPDTVRTGRGWGQILGDL